MDSPSPSRWFDLGRLRHDAGLAGVDFYSTCASTNDLARDAALAGATPPRLTLTDEQTAGRGRGANRWWANGGALTFSLLIDPLAAGLTGGRLPQASLTTALAVSDMLQLQLPAHHAGVKWPNDVHLNGRKVCGILIEPVPGRPDRLVIGIGVNVLNSFREAPEELRELATSMLDEAARRDTDGRGAGALRDLTDTLLTLLICLQTRLADLALGRLDLIGEWQVRCVLTGHRVTLTAGDQRVTGVCRGIDTSGALRIEAADGSVRSWFGGVVRRLPDEAAG